MYRGDLVVSGDVSLDESIALFYKMAGVQTLDGSLVVTNTDISGSELMAATWAPLASATFPRTPLWHICPQAALRPCLDVDLSEPTNSPTFPTLHTLAFLRTADIILPCAGPTPMLFALRLN